MNLPEGLYVFMNERDEEELRDAQDHVWLTFHKKAHGDSHLWQTELRRLVLKALRVVPETISQQEFSSWLAAAGGRYSTGNERLGQAYMNELALRHPLIAEWITEHYPETDPYYDNHKIPALIMLLTDRVVSE